MKSTTDHLLDDHMVEEQGHHLNQEAKQRKLQLGNSKHLAAQLIFVIE